MSLKVQIYVSELDLGEFIIKMPNRLVNEACIIGEKEIDGRMVYKFSVTAKEDVHEKIVETMSKFPEFFTEAAEKDPQAEVVLF